MTWGEFKRYAEANGVKDEHEIWFIDFSFNDEPEIVLPNGKEGLQIG